MFLLEHAVSQLYFQPLNHFNVLVKVTTYRKQQMSIHINVTSHLSN